MNGSPTGTGQNYGVPLPDGRDTDMRYRGKTVDSEVSISGRRFDVCDKILPESPTVGQPSRDQSDRTVSSLNLRQLYTRSWTHYKNVESLNHKTDGAVLEELERSTGIAPRFLTDFSPGIDDARSRLRWASSRRAEDIAYSLFGIFNINNLHVSYGGSAEDALDRLLAEIISLSGDISILDWVGVPSQFHCRFPTSITSYGTLLSPPLPPEEQSLTVAQQATPSKALRKFCGTLTKSSLPRFINRRPILPCLSYRVDVVRLKSADASSPSYTYEIQASGLKPLEITLPGELENAMAVPDALQLARPWHSKSLGGSTKSDRDATEELLATLGRPFYALLLTVLPHNEYKRIASSTVIVAQPIDLASILRNKLRTFEIV
ncbi:hypothetical protein EDD15DRAFT_2371137 [Pisolithus albus]|nr:hypothetical protein EDD15DRAFT_2371137 [Pisolithus albus]